MTSLVDALAVKTLLAAVVESEVDTRERSSVFQVTFCLEDIPHLGTNR